MCSRCTLAMVVACGAAFTLSGEIRADAPPRELRLAALLAPRDDGERDLDALVADVETVARRAVTDAAGDGVTAQALARARRAIGEARALRRAHDERAAGRQVRIARAAIARADRRIAHAQARAELEATRKRLDDARAHAARAREERSAAERRLAEARKPVP